MLKKEFLERAEQVHGDAYSYNDLPKHIKVSGYIEVVCEAHGAWNQMISNHLKGYGCKFCGIEKTANSHLLGKGAFLKRAYEIHGDTYSYVKIPDKFTTKDKLTITCHIHGDFQQKLDNHLQGKGCMNCGRIRTSNKKRLSTSDFIKKAKFQFGDKYDYSISEFIDIICKIHGAFKQRMGNHLQGKEGCLECRRSKYSRRYEDLRPSTKQIRNQLTKLHPNLTILKAVQSIDKQKVTADCSKHGIFERYCHEMLKGKGCPTCGHERGAFKQRLSQQEFIQRASKILDNVSFGKVQYETMHVPVVLTCSIHGDYRAMPYNVIHGKKGCLKCCRKLREIKIKGHSFWIRSKNEKQSLKMIIDRTSIVASQIYDCTSKKIPKIILEDGYRHEPDFYIPDRNIIV